MTTLMTPGTDWGFVSQGTYSATTASVWLLFKDGSTLSLAEAPPTGSWVSDHSAFNEATQEDHARPDN